MAPTNNPSTPDDKNTGSDVEENLTNDGPSTVTDAEYEAMHTLLTNIYNFRTKDGEDPSRIFHRKVNKRMVPNYYDVIKEPMAMSMIKTKITSKAYKSFEEFVRDWALVSHNAQVYNAPTAQAFQDAVTLREVVKDELQKLVVSNTVSKDRIELPFLGELPPPDEIATEDADDDEDDEDDDDDDDDESETEGKKKRKGRPSVGSRREREDKDKDDDQDHRKKRGRPPRVDTPMEARIKAIMKGLRKPRTAAGDLMILNFERIPDKQVLPEYFREVKQPMAFDVLKKKLKRKKYNTIDQFMRDVDLMFDNAKQYNEDGSQIYKDAITLQQEARNIADTEKQKPDSDFLMEDGRIPLPEGILHNGELWKVGDWVHLQNPNDLTKPIVAQIYRTYQDPEGSKWINACWYYRPEQTVHRFDKHFFESEVVKTGQYRDHPVDEIVDQCFVMFITRFNKGRPRGFPQDKDVYVCEARYNEEKHKINKIKTWASCLPDEVRDKDYEMDLFDVPKKLKKVPSPIEYLFKQDQQKSSDDLPKPVWGAPNAPPKIGAVHCRPRDPKESPPPEPTPSPPPQAPPPQPVRQLSNNQSNGYADNKSPHMNTPSNSHPVPLQPNPTPLPTAPTYSVSTPTPNHGHLSRPGYSGPTSQTYQPHNAQHALAQQQYNSQRNAQSGGQQQQQQVYKAPNPVEVWHLPEPANASIPPEIRKQFHSDAYGHILFYTAPPAPSEIPEKQKLKHSTAYLAFKARQSEKSKRQLEQTTVGADNNSTSSKKTRKEDAESKAEDEKDAITLITNMLTDATIAQFKQIYGEKEWAEYMTKHLDALAEIEADRENNQNTQSTKPNLKGLNNMLDYKPAHDDMEWSK